MKLKSFQQPITINQSNIIFASPGEKVGQKATNILVRIDNSGNGVHQIVKRKKTKEGNMLQSANSQVIDEEERALSPPLGREDQPTESEEPIS